MVCEGDKSGPLAAFAKIPEGNIQDHPPLRIVRVLFCDSTSTEGRPSAGGTTFWFRLRVEREVW